MAMTSLMAIITIMIVVGMPLAVLVLTYYASAIFLALTQDNRIRQDYAMLQKTYAILQKAYAILQKNCALLQDNYAMLQEDYASLLEIHESLQKEAIDRNRALEQKVDELDLT
jgi:hypothetical protein